MMHFNDFFILRVILHLKKFCILALIDDIFMIISADDVMPGSYRCHITYYRITFRYIESCSA